MARSGVPESLHADHLALPVYDASASLAFYADVLQLPLIDVHSGDDWGGKEWLMMIFGLGDGRQISLIAFHGAKKAKVKANGLPADAHHYACAVPTLAALAAWKAKLTAAKIAFAEEDHGNQQSIYFSDPNGIMWEITAPPSKRSTKNDKTARSRAVAWIAAHEKRSASR